MANGNKVVIEVTPQPGSDPEVELSDRNPNGKNKKEIRWERAKDAPAFDFIGFAPDTPVSGAAPNPFKKIKIANHRIKCDFEPQASQIEYPYTIVIEHNGVAIDSDELGRPTFGKAVIRN